MLLLKDKIIFVFIEGFHIPHRQSSFIEGRIFHYKVPFLLNFASLKKILQKKSSGGILLRRCFRNFAKFTGKHMCQRVLVNKVSGLSSATLLKKTLWHRGFPANLAKFLRTPLFTEHLRWLLLILQRVKSRTRMFSAFYV